MASKVPPCRGYEGDTGPEEDDDSVFGEADCG